MKELVNLSKPTVFPDLNIQETKIADFCRETINVETLKYKHIRAALKYPETEQMHQLMMMVTGLNENDIGELLPEDAGKLTLMLHNSLIKFNQPIEM